LHPHQPHTSQNSNEPLGGGEDLFDKMGLWPNGGGEGPLT